MSTVSDDTDRAESEIFDEAEERTMNEAASLEISLFQAVMKKDLQAFEKALDRASKLGLDTDKVYNASSSFGNSLIHVAARYGNGEVVRHMADRVDLRDLLSKVNKEGDTVLHIAVRTEDESVFNVLKDLLQHGYREDEESGSSDWKHRMLTVKNLRGNTALHEALIHRHERMAAYLMVLVDNDVFFRTNKDGKSALYLSVEARYLNCAKHMLENVPNNSATYEKLGMGKSIIHAAIEGKHRVISRLLIDTLPKLKYVKNEMGRNPLHVAAFLGALQVMGYLIDSGHNSGLDEFDMNGMMPIHYAVMNNSVRVMKELLMHCHDPCELVTRRGENILHVAAKYGRYNVVRRILQSPELNVLLNQRDYFGNTPLHLASQECCPSIVRALTWDDRIKVDVQNNMKQTALDVIGSGQSAINQVFKRMLTLAALNAARTPTVVQQTFTRKQNETAETYKDKVNYLLLASTLVATVTFAAGFTVPGAYNSSEAPNDPGMATNLKHTAFQVFLISNTIAMYSAMMVVAVLMWAQLEDIRIMRSSHRFALPLLGTALSMMCTAYMAGVYVTVSQIRWVAIFILVIGCFFLAFIIGIFFLLGFPTDTQKPLARFIINYIIYGVLLITERETRPEGINNKIERLSQELLHREGRRRHKEYLY